MKAKIEVDGNIIELEGTTEEIWAILLNIYDMTPGIPSPITPPEDTPTIIPPPPDEPEDEPEPPQHPQAEQEPGPAPEPKPEPEAQHKPAMAFEPSRTAPYGDQGQVRQSYAPLYHKVLGCSLKEYISKDPNISTESYIIDITNKCLSQGNDPPPEPRLRATIDAAKKVLSAEAAAKRGQ